MGVSVMKNLIHLTSCFIIIFRNYAVKLSIVIIALILTNLVAIAQLVNSNVEIGSETQKNTFSNQDNVIPYNPKSYESEIIKSKTNFKQSDYLFGECDKKDTIKKFYERSSSFKKYYYTDIYGYRYPITGSNPEYHFLGFQFDLEPVEDESLYLDGFLVAYAKIFISGSPDEVWTIITSSNENGDPERYIFMDYKLYSLDDINPNDVEPMFHYVKLSSTLELCSDFIILICTKGVDPVNPGYNIDEVWLWSNTHGDGNMEFRCNTMTMRDNELYWYELEKYYYFDGIDIDIMILPIIAQEEGLSVGYKSNGISINNIYPNPAMDYANLNFSLEEYSNVSISLIGLDGKILKSCFNEFLESGNHIIPLDLKEIPSGNYFLAVQTNKTKFALKISIVK